MSASNRICEVLVLRLDRLRIELLGLIVDIPEPVILTLTANSRGGVLGDLFCKIVGARVVFPRNLSSVARRLTAVAQAGGLSKTGISVNLPLAPSGMEQQPGEITCQVLEVILGPLELRLLGLRLTLSRVHLLILGDPFAGPLGDLVCRLVASRIPIP